MIFNKNNIFTSEFSLLAKQNHKVILIHHLKCGVSLENLDPKCFYKDLNVYQTHLCFCAHYQCHSNLNAKNTQITPTRYKNLSMSSSTKHNYCFQYIKNTRHTHHAIYFAIPSSYNSIYLICFFVGCLH